MMVSRTRSFRFFTLKNLPLAAIKDCDLVEAVRFYFLTAGVLAVLVSSIGTEMSFGQAPATPNSITGRPLFETAQTNAVDRISIGNLNIHHVVPIRSKAGLIPFSANLEHDNTPWSIQTYSNGNKQWGFNMANQGFVSTSPFDWVAQTPVNAGLPATYASSSKTCPDGVTSTTVYNQWSYIDVFNTAHGAALQIDSAGCFSGGKTAVGTTVDGYTLTVSTTNALGANPPALPFQGIPRGQSEVLVEKLTNNYTSTITISAINLNGVAFSDAANVPITLTPGTSYSFNVTFSPTTAGTFSGNLSVIFSAADGTPVNSPLNIALSGTGTSSGTSGSQGPLYPTSVTQTQYGPERAWTSLTNVETLNNGYATSGPLLSGQCTYNLYASNFHFSIPAGSTINGVSVTINAADIGDPSKSILNSVFYLTTNGTWMGQARDSLTWGHTFQQMTVGGSTDKWGLSLTNADVNSSTFGVLFYGLENYGAYANGSAALDAISIKLWYTCPTCSAMDEQVASLNASAGISAPSVFAKVVSPSGMTYQTNVTQNPNGAQLDAFHVSVSGSNTVDDPLVYTDSLGQTVLTRFGSGTTPEITSGRTEEYFYTDGNAQTSAYYVHYSQFTLQTNFGCAAIAEGNSQGVWLATTIDIPGQTSAYALTYESTPGFPANDPTGLPYTTGRIASITIPSGGQIKYTYTGANGGVNCADGTAIGFTKLTPDSATPWTYSRSFSSGYWTTTVTDPLSNVTTYNFDQTGTYELQHTVTDATNGALETVVTCYNGNNSNCGQFSGAISTPIRRRTVTTKIPGASGVWSAIDTFYTTNLPTEVDEYDFGVLGSGSIGALKRKTGTTYGTYQDGTGCVAIGSNILDRPCSVVVSDNQTPANTDSNVRNSYDPNGNLTRIATYTGPPENVWLYKYFGYDTNGAVNSVKDVNGTSTTYTNTACQNAFPTTVATGSLSKTITWDCVGGVETSITDENSHKSTYSHADPFWRLTSTTVASGDALQATTNNSYPVFPTTATYETSLLFNSNNSTLDTVTTVDVLGRPYLVQNRQSPTSSNYDTTYQQYDANGRVSKVFLPCSAALGGTCSGSSIKTLFDALNRTTSVTDGGNGMVSYTYTNNDVLQKISPAPAGENAKSKSIEYDAMGRLTSVCEITGTTNGGGICNQTNTQTGYWTTYLWDALHLNSVTQSAQGGTSQSRGFTWDYLGRMLKENNPESGTTQYFWDSVTPDCGSQTNGDISETKNNAGGIICYSHDSLHRLQTTSANGSGCRVLAYDSTTTPANPLPTGVTVANTAGELVEAYTATSCSGGSPITDEWFSYSSRGELTDVYESTPNSGGYYHSKAQYFPNGNPSSLSAIPHQTAPWSFGIDGEGRVSTVTNGTTSLVTNTVYNPDGQVATLTFGTADTDAYTYYSTTGRMKSYQFTVGGQSVIGNLTWNANGSLGSLAITQDPFNQPNVQTCGYGYDDLARVQNVSCTPPSSQTPIWAQSFRYDPFGNVSKSGTSTFQPTYSTSTNQITSVGGTGPIYDSNGNIQSMNIAGAHAFTWDANFGNLLIMDGRNLIYDGLGRLVEQTGTAGIKQTLYTPIGKLGIMSGQNVSYIVLPLPGGDGAEYITSASAPSHYHHSDWLGSTRFSSTVSSTMFSDVGYAPFGEFYGLAGSADRSFTGQREDVESGFYNFPYRQYQPAEGRWISPDPSGFSAVDISDPQSWNRYSYVGNRPLDSVDPLGLDAMPNWFVGGGGPGIPGLDAGGGQWGYVGGGLNGSPTGSWSCNGTGDCIPGPILPPSGYGSGRGRGATDNGMRQGLLPGENSTDWSMPFSLADLLGINPGGGGCEFGACGSSFQNPAVVAGAAVACVEAEPCGAIGGLILGVGVLYHGYELYRAGKENIRPSWAEKYGLPRPGESGNQFADRVCKAEFGPTGCPGGEGPGSDYSKLKKWADRRGK